MAKKKAAAKNTKSFEESLWKTATKLRGTLLPKLIIGELRIEDAEKMVGGMG
ncbi:hypothetical protein P4E94_11085 [Pontiellaceae bacterium B12219]|nr:hypothetical protein [Pontiellaceae bacterium B12219]